jgi:hypothetical protein
MPRYGEVFDARLVEVRQVLKRVQRALLEDAPGVGSEMLWGPAGCGTR